MNKERDLRESLSELTRDVAETASYFSELGVELAGPFSSFDSRADESADDSPLRSASHALPEALKRNARADEAAKLSSSPFALDEILRTHSAVGEFFESSAFERPTIESKAGTKTADPTEEFAPVSQNQEAMPKKPVRAPSDNPPPPQDTLFGEIKPKDELSLGRPGETFEDIWNDIGECVRCPLHKGRTNIVNSEGDRKARLMFVGEAPGADEDATGRPFVGRAGQLLNKIIDAIGLKREEILIGNVNRCRPPANRQPTTEEAKTCKPFLLREIAVARPEVIVVLGNTAMKNLLDTKVGITKIRGQFQDYQGIKVMPTFHPAYLLRDPTKKRETWDDMKKVRDYLNGAKKR